MIRCPACGVENKSSVKFCPECGATLSAESVADSDRTVLLPPQPKRVPGTIEQAMRLSPDARKLGDRPPPTPPDNEMTVVLPKKSTPPPKYEPAPPTVTGPLTEPAPPGKSSRRRAGNEQSPVRAAVTRPKTPLAVVLALLMIAGGSAGYLGWLILKKNKLSAPTEKIAVAPSVAAPVPPPAAMSPVPAPQPAPPLQPAPAAPSAALAKLPEMPATPPPQAPKTVAPVDSKPVSVTPAPPAESAKTDATRAEKSKAEQLKKEQVRQEAVKKDKQKKVASASIMPSEPRTVEMPRAPTPAAAEPAKQESTPVAMLRDELRACDAQSVFSRESCKNQTRQRRCAGMWDRIPECPYKKEDGLY